MQHTKLGTYTVYFENAEEFHLIKREIFVQKIYDFEFAELAEKAQPLIVDAGAHIGLTTLFFKKNYQHARIVALEPHPTNFELLEKNVWENQLTNIETRPQALAAKTAKITLHADTVWDWFSTASIHKGAWTGNQQTVNFTVDAISLDDLQKELDQPIDLLKLDIEGAEQTVLEAGKKGLNQVNNLVIEFHPHKKQSITKLIKLLQEAGFQVSVWQDEKQVDPKKVSGLMIIVAQRSPHS